MTDLQNYERLFPEKAEGKLLFKRILFLFLYVSWGCLWTVIMLRRGISAPMLFFIPLTTVALVMLTWPLTQTELEYTLAAGTFYLARIYGKKKRKELVEAELSTALLIAPDTEENRNKATALSPADVISAVSTSKAENLWLMVFESAPSERLLVYVEMEEEMLRILRHACPRITSRDKLTPTNQTGENV
jgi:hypothetical protein